MHFVCLILNQQAINQFDHQTHSYVMMGVLWVYSLENSTDNCLASYLKPQLLKNKIITSIIFLDWISYVILNTHIREKRVRSLNWPLIPQCIAKVIDVINVNTTSFLLFHYMRINCSLFHSYAPQVEELQNSNTNEDGVMFLKLKKEKEK